MSMIHINGTGNNEKDTFVVDYIQQQEQFLLNCIREKFNLQIQIGNLAKSIESIKNLYNESQSEVAKQNEIMKQATFSIEKLTNDLKICGDISNDRMNLISELNQKLVEFEQIKSIHASTQKEFQRVNNELNILHSENEQLSADLSKAKAAVTLYDQSSLAKKQRPKTKKTTDENTF